LSLKWKLLQNSLNLFSRFIGDGDKFDGLSSGLGLQFIEHRERGNARCTPGCPEVDNNNLATQFQPCWMMIALQSGYIEKRLARAHGQRRLDRRIGRRRLGHRGYGAKNQDRKEAGRLHCTKGYHVRESLLKAGGRWEGAAQGYRRSHFQHDSGGGNQDAPTMSLRVRCLRFGNRKIPERLANEVSAFGQRHEGALHLRSEFLPRGFLLREAEDPIKQRA
jgi:hypothetical protein